MRPTPDRRRPARKAWSYPRPAIAKACERRITIVHRGVTLADTRRAVRTLETSHPPSYYFPPDDIDQTALARSSGSSFCEWKGAANYFDVTLQGEIFRDVAWSYAQPTPAFALLRDHIAFYAAPFDQCLIDGEQVTPQPGGFYGGWITPREAGPFKGVPGSRFW
ncbi:DUF427 domain-containing protein [Chenggangzhangella methanolivorans]|uniref:DUF427 domain-containing protein n=1 Tax=Chenggangzhangella methanolivorans TaxID=1437009 RepID=A0A9E6RIA7_9HYPH|nr:DUF427 domain-containing protein [Chenggangzhangella methanolivorans]